MRSSKFSKIAVLLGAFALASFNLYGCGTGNTKPVNPWHLIGTGMQVIVSDPEQDLTPEQRRAGAFSGEMIKDYGRRKHIEEQVQGDDQKGEPCHYNTRRYKQDEVNEDFVVDIVTGNVIPKRVLCY